MSQLLNPASWANTKNIVSNNSSGELTTKTFPNYAETPGLFSNNLNYNGGNQWSGTTCNITAAKGLYSQSGGKKSHSKYMRKKTTSKKQLGGVRRRTRRRTRRHNKHSGGYTYKSSELGGKISKHRRSHKHSKKSKKHAKKHKKHSRKHHMTHKKQSGGLNKMRQMLGFTQKPKEVEMPVRSHPPSKLEERLQEVRDGIDKPAPATGKSMTPADMKSRERGEEARKQHEAAEEAAAAVEKAADKKAHAAAPLKKLQAKHGAVRRYVGGGYTLNPAIIGANSSALASPLPIVNYDNCPF